MLRMSVRFQISLARLLLCITGLFVGMVIFGRTLGPAGVELGLGLFIPTFLLGTALIGASLGGLFNRAMVGAAVAPPVILVILIILAYGIH
jgi:hypothetical protein